MISNSSGGKKVGLRRTNDFLEVRFDSVVYKLDENLVLCIAQANRSKILQRGCILAFGNKANVSSISFIINSIS